MIPGALIIVPSRTGAEHRCEYRLAPQGQFDLNLRASSSQTPNGAPQVVLQIPAQILKRRIIERPYKLGFRYLFWQATLGPPADLNQPVSKVD